MIMETKYIPERPYMHIADSEATRTGGSSSPLKKKKHLYSMLLFVDVRHAFNALCVVRLLWVSVFCPTLQDLLR